MKPVMLSLLLAAALGSAAQRIDDRLGAQNMLANNLFYTGVNGEPLSTMKYSKLIEGSPYFIDNWQKAIVVMPDGKAYNNVDAKLDLVENTLHFRNAQGQELIVKAPVSEVIFPDAAGAPLYHFVAADALPVAAPKKGWYQLLQSGTVSLYKHFGKELWEQKPYGSATEEQRILSKPTYFLVQNGTGTEIKKVKEIPNVLRAKKSELDALLKKQPSDASDDAKITALVSYYNSLQ